MEELNLDKGCSCYMFLTAIQFLCCVVCESHVCLAQCNMTSLCLRGDYYVTVAILSALKSSCM